MKNKYSDELRYANGCSDDFTFVPASIDIPRSEYSDLLKVGLIGLSMQLAIFICLVMALICYVQNGGKIFDFEFLKNDVVIYENKSNGTIVYEIAKNHETAAGKTKVIQRRRERAAVSHLPKT